MMMEKELLPGHHDWDPRTVDDEEDYLNQLHLHTNKRLEEGTKQKAIMRPVTCLF